MASHRLSSYDVRGQVYLARLAEVGVPTELRPAVRSFAAAQADFHARCEDVAHAKAALDTAKLGAHVAAEGVRAAVETLADALVGAHLAPRGSPLARLGGRSPSRLMRVASTTAIAQVRAMIAAVVASTPPATLREALRGCERACDAVETALAAISAPDLTYKRALGSRDAALATHVAALATLKRRAAVVWEDDPILFKAIFSRPAPQQVAPTAHRRTRVTPVTGVPTTSGATTPSAPGQGVGSVPAQGTATSPEAAGEIEGRGARPTARPRPAA